ncbi:MAG: phosphopantothenate/pantothenate synthetase [Candidatus Diapherotrites archaeon]
MNSIPSNHPRFNSLNQRHLIELGVKKGITSPQGLIAQGRGEAFDYLLKEKTSKFAEQAIKASAALLLLAKNPVISTNGNTAVLCPKELIKLSNSLKCEIEVNLFYRTPKREKLISKEFKKLGKEILGAGKKTKLRNLSSNRALVDPNGIGIADVVLVMLEDGDRTNALIKAKKKVIAIDLNPLSRTPQTATISITDNVSRAVPLIAEQVKKLRNKKKPELQKIISNYNNKLNLRNSINLIRKGI